MKKVKRKPIEPEPTQDESDESAARIIPIRTETALSQYPIHTLVKKGKLTIKVTNTNERGKVITTWKVSGSKEYGDPGPLAYKIDSLVLTRRVDEMRPHIPEIIRLGSLTEIAREVGVGEKNTNNVKRALHQNASAYITAKLTYKGYDGAQRDFEFGGTRYEIVFYGERLPNGQKADAVYVILHRTYRELLLYARTRPLDYEYLKTLPPASQRFYELISFQVYGALKNNNPRAKYRYSDLCRCAPLTRYDNWEQVKKQLYKIHKPHIDSGYLKNIEYEPTTDEDGKPDWVICYTPGPKAHREFREFTKTRAESRPAPPHLILPALVDPPRPGSRTKGSPPVHPVPPGRDRDRAGANGDESLIEGLRAIGFNGRDSRELATRYPESSRRELEAWPYRDKSKMREPLAVLRKAIVEGDYTPPPALEKKKAVAKKKRETSEIAAEQKAREEHRERSLAAYCEYLRPERSRIELEQAEEYKRFADFIGRQRLPDNLSRAQREAIVLSFFEEFIEERPELRVMTFWQWDAKRTQA